MAGKGDGARPAPGHRRFGPVAGVVLLSLTIALAVASAVLLFVGGGFGRIVWGLPGVQSLWALGFLAAGYPITCYHTANPVGWCLMAASAAASVNGLGLSLGMGTAAADLGGLVSWLASAWVISVGALCSAVVLFPSGAPPSRGWWAQLVVLWGSGVLVFCQNLFTGAGPLGSVAVPVDSVFQLSLVVGFLSLLVRWRRSGPVERLQLKWVAYGVVLVATTALVVELVISNLAPDLYLLGTVALSVVILAVPATIGVAILRYRLYDIDVVINRTLVYASLTATLVVVYFGSVVSLQQLLSPVVGEDNELAVVASTILIAALFGPLRRRVQGFIDRRFYRNKYDARKTLEAFSVKLRGASDLDGLNGELLAVVRETVQPAYASLWLRATRERGAGEREAGR